MSVVPSGIITLTTDFGVSDGYVGLMQGVILGLNPKARLVDLSHTVPPQDVEAAAFILAAARDYFPPGTVHLGVVDPGVGTSRRALAVQAHRQFWVGPDNGILHLALAGAAPEAVSLDNPAFFLPRVSATFHGRDLFAPVAAHLSLGIPLAQFGPPAGPLVTLDIPAPLLSPQAIQGEILYIDHFGNLITTIPFPDVQARGSGARVRVHGDRLYDAPLVRTYADASPGTLVALEGSHGYLEIACVQGHAGHLTQAGRRARVEVAFAAPPP